MVQRVKQAQETSLGPAVFFFFSFCFLILILYFRYHDAHTTTIDNDGGARELAIRVKQAQEPQARLRYFFFPLTVKKILPIFGYLKTTWSAWSRPFFSSGRWPAGQLGPGWVVATPSVVAAWPIFTEIAVMGHFSYRRESPHLERTQSCRAKQWPTSASHHE